MIYTEEHNRKILFRHNNYTSKYSNLIYCHFLVTGKEMEDIFYWYHKIYKDGISYSIKMRHDVYSSTYDLNEIKHYFFLYQDNRIFHVYALQKETMKFDSDMELELRLITMDMDLINKLERKKEEKTYKYLI